MVNAKRKGNQWENRLAKWLTENGIKAWKDPASGGANREKGDIINNADMTIESKAAKTIKLMEWWRQVAYSASIHKNRPVLFIHQDGMGADEWLVVMNNSDWVEMAKADQGVVETPEMEMTYEQRSALNSLKIATSRVLKLF